MPSKTLRQKQDIPWLTPEIKRLIRKRDRIYKKLKSTRVEERPNIIKKTQICKTFSTTKAQTILPELYRKHNNNFGHS